MKTKLKVKLLSPLLSGDGESSMGVIDSDVCFDDVGIPFIPAKRIKGLLSEIAYENPKDEKTLDDLFGIMGSQEGHLIINNGYIKDYHSIYNALKRKIKEKTIYPEQIREYFTSIRTQTTINDKGVAKEHSLRTMRVINKDKDRVFEFDINLDSKEESDLLKECCEKLTHMGTKRSRGFGHVKCTLDECDFKKDEENEENQKNEKNLKKDKIKYILTLESQVLMSSRGSDFEACDDYISGNSILGYFANRYIKNHSEDEFKNAFFYSNLKFNNAYISSDGETEFFPAPLCFVKEKIEDKKFHNIALKDLDDIQIKNLKASYIGKKDDNYMRIEPKFEIEYHHARPKDKGIGKSLESTGETYLESGQYFQFKVLSKGQKFIGSIEGEPEKISEILSVLPKDQIITIGRSRTSQYGRVKFEIISEENETQEKDIQIAADEKFVFLLISPMILHDPEGNIIPDYKSLLENDNIKACVKVEDVKRVFLNFTTISGYNAKWGLPRPQVDAIDKGSVLVFEAKEDFKSSDLENKAYGMMQSRGFGRIKILKINPEETEIDIVDLKDDENDNNNKNDENPEVDKIINSIKKKKEINKHIEEGINAARKLKDLPNSTTVGRLVSMLNSIIYDDKIKPEKKYSKFLNCIDRIIKKDKTKEDKYGKFFDGKNDIHYARAFLEELKLRIRREKP